MSTLKTSNFQSLTAGTPPVFKDLNGTEIGQLCRAWVNFNGTTSSPSTIRGSFNVTSVTKNGTGDYTVNFTTALADANYVFTTGTNRANTGLFPWILCYRDGQTKTVSAIRLDALATGSTTLVDPVECYAAIFR